MIALKDLMAMRAPLRLAAMATIAALTFTSPAQAQTSTSCNPTEETDCAADPALGTSVTVDFTSGKSDQFTAEGEPTYNSSGVCFTITESGDAPTLVSDWYIMFGKYSITMKAAPGKGIVSSAVLLSDDLDEIDWEWLGAYDSEVQTNYYMQGKTDTSDRAATLSASTTQEDFHTYELEWTDEQIVWSIDGTVARTLLAADAPDGEYPQTPCRLKFGIWSAGDSSNAEGTIEWADGPTDYSDGPFTMIVSSVSVTDYSTGTEYTYGNESGVWESIESTGGTINGNYNGSTTDTASSTTSSSTSTITYTTLPGLPSGWTVSSSGKVVASSSTTTSLATSTTSSSTSSSAASPVALCSALSSSVVTSYDQQGFLTTATVPVGVSTGWDDQGFATTIYPSSCQASSTASASVSAALLFNEAQPTTTMTSTSSSMSTSTTTRSSLVAAVSADSTTLITASVSETSDAPKTLNQLVAGTCTVLLALTFAAFMA